MVIPFLQLELLRPGWLVLLVVLPVVFYAARQGITGMSALFGRLTTGLRVAIVVCLVLALGGVTWLRHSEQQYVVFVHDRTASVDPAESSSAEQFIADAVTGQNSNESAIVTIVFSDRSASGDDQLWVDLALDLQAAAATIPADYVGKVVLLSDGHTPSAKLLDAAAGLGMPVSIVPLKSFAAPEVLVVQLNAPSHARPGSMVDVEAVVRSSGNTASVLQWARDGESVSRQDVQLVAGDNRFRATLRVGSSGRSIIAAEIENVDDTRAGNNLARAVVMIDPKPRVLLLESEPELAGPLLAVLKADQLAVDQMLPRQMDADPNKLRQYDLLILSNVAADQLDKKQLAAIDAYVREQGGGLLVIGGRAAFDPKTLAKSDLQRMLPVSGHVEAAEKKPTMAMVLAIDKSSSMRVGRRLELAKVAAKKAVEGLSPRDKIGVIAFGDDAQWVSEIRPFADKRAVLAQIDRLSPSGRTNMYPALEKAYLALREADADRKHVILLTDGLSAPGDFDAVAKAMAAAGITISTIAVGADADQVVLRDIAGAAGGRHYQCDNAQQLPDIFADEVAKATKSVLKEGVFLPHVISPSPKLIGAAIHSAPALSGYVQTSPKPTAELVLATDAGDPLLAWWRYGRGVVIAFTSDAKTRWAGQWTEWPGYEDFWRRLARHAMRAPPPADFTLSVRPQWGQSRVTLEATTSAGGYQNGLDCRVKIDGANEVIMRQIAPGRYEALLDTSHTGIYTLECVVRRDAKKLYHTTHGLSVDYSPELRSAATNVELLKAVAEISGGKFAITSADVFAPDGRVVLRPARLWSGLLILSALLLVIDVTLRRVALGRKRG